MAKTKKKLFYTGQPPVTGETDVRPVKVVKGEKATLPIDSPYLDAPNTDPNIVKFVSFQITEKFARLYALSEDGDIYRLIIDSALGFQKIKVEHEE